MNNKTIDDSEISCKEGLLGYVHYRARIRGTSSYSVGGLLAILQQWTQKETTAFISLFSTRLFVNSRCNTVLDSPAAPNCLQTFQSTTNTSKPPVIIPGQSKAEFGGPEIGGLVVGVLIALLLLGFIILLIVLLLKMRTQSRYSSD